MRALTVVTVLVPLVLLCGCGATDGGDDPGRDQPTEAELVRSTSSPEGCEPDALPIEADVVVPLLYGRADDTTVPGLGLTLLSARAGEDRVRLEVRRRSAGCRVSAEVVIPARRPVTVLGVELRTSATASDPDVPNRTRVSVTVLAR